MKHLVLLLWLFAVGCSPASAEPLSAGPYRITLTTDPAAPGVGDNVLHVGVTAAGQSVDARISIHEDMVGMVMSMPPIKLTRVGVGLYDGTLSVPMAGQWQLDLQVEGLQGSGRAMTTVTAGDRPAHPPASASGPYRIRLSVPQPHVGDRPMHLGVADSEGHPVAGVHVYVHAAMPGMALQLHPVEATPVAAGDYAATLPLSMVGAWKVTVEVEGPAGHTVQTFTQVIEPSDTRWTTAVLVLAAFTIAGTLLWRRQWATLALAVVLVAVAIGATWLAHRKAAPDKTMGMTMDMVRPDMGMAPSDLQAAVPVAIETVEPGPIAQTATYTGSVAPVVEDTVYPRVQGWLQDVRVYAGDAVHEGDIVARLDDPQLASQLAVQQAASRTARARVQVASLQARQAQAGVAMAQSEVEAARTEVVMARTDIDKRAADAHFQAVELARDRLLLAGGGIPLEQVQQQEAMTTAAQAELHHGHDALRQAEATLQGKQAAWRQAQLAAQAGRQAVDVQGLEAEEAQASQGAQQTLSDFTTVRARISGVVTQRLVDPGVLVQPGTALFKIAALDHVRLQAAVAESDLLSIHRGTLVEVSSPDLPHPIQTRITSVFHSADSKSHTGTVEALVRNRGGHLLPGSYLVMRFDLQRAEHVLTVHRSAIIRDQRVSVWKVIERAGQTVAIRVPVETGLDDGQRVAIRQGLQAGDRIIWAGLEGLQDGAAVTPAQWGSGPYRDMLEVQP